MDGTITILVVSAVAAILVSASVFDWKYREIPDWHWFMIFAIAIALSIYKVIDLEIGFVGTLIPVCIAFIAFDCLYDRDTSTAMDFIVYGGIISVSIMGFMNLPDEVAKVFLSIPIMYAVMTVLYYTGIVKGGADAKSIIAIATVFPTYPEFLGLPLIDVPEGLMARFFIPAFAVLTMALVISLLYGLYNVVRNVKDGNVLFPQMILGMIMPLDRAKTSKVWPMEDVVDGESVILSSGTEDPNAWKRLESYGKKDVWVTAIIPFLVPITIAYALMVVLGFPLFIL